MRVGALGRSVLIAVLSLFSAGAPAFCEPRSESEEAQLRPRLLAYIRSVQDPQTGFPVSFSDSIDPLLKNITFTYDVAVSALALSHAGDPASARRALAPFLNLPLPSPDTYDFNTAYDSRQARPRLEYRVHGGPMFWVVIAMLRSAEATRDEELRTKAVALLVWAARELPHIDGGVAMSHKDEWREILSTENNWVYYVALRLAVRQMPDGPERHLLMEEKRRVRNWLKGIGVNRGFRPPATTDGVRALDVFTHPLLVGPEAQLEDGGFASVEEMGAWAKEHIALLEEYFKVPDTQRYEYTDGAEAAAIGRERFGWLEGTEQVAVAYQTWADWFRRTGDTAYADSLEGLAAASHAEVVRFALTLGDTIAIPNTDAVLSFQTFQDGWPARPMTEAALNGTTWAYFAACRYNPFAAPLRATVETTGE